MASFFALFQCSACCQQDSDDFIVTDFVEIDHKDRKAEPLSIKIPSNPEQGCQDRREEVSSAAAHERVPADSQKNERQTADAQRDEGTAASSVVERDAVQDAQQNAFAPEQKRGVLGRCTASIEAAVSRGPENDFVAADRDLLIAALEACIVLLDTIGGLGKYLTGNVEKIKGAKADRSQSDFKAFMLSELPVHASTKFRSYEDKSAWMGNLWLAWTLEFFVEMFGSLAGGMETSASVSEAYKKTLYNHHNLLQRATFTAAVKSLPTRGKLFQKLQGEARLEDIPGEAASFAEVGRPLIKYLQVVTDAVNARMEQERKAKYGK